MIPALQQLNFDLNFLYTIARTVLPKDILEALMYGQDFDDPSEEDLKEIRMLIKNNMGKLSINLEDEWYRDANNAACKDMDAKLDKLILEELNNVTRREPR